MTRDVPLPSPTRARRVADQYLADCQHTRKRPSVLGLAAQLALTNTTFRRHFPELVQEISTARADPSPAAGSEQPTRPHDALVARNSKLRRANRTLTANLRLAAAQIQRLALDNARLREALEASANITRIDRPGRPERR